MCFLKVDKFIQAMRDGDVSFAKSFSPFPMGKVVNDIPYIDDKNFEHHLDILYPEESNDVLLFNVHGGGYCYGYKEQSYIYCSYYANKGFQVVSMNYTLMNKDKEMSIETQIREVLLSIYFILENKEKFNLSFNKIVLMGDSAGGHIALMVSLALKHPLIRKIYGVDGTNIEIAKLVLSSPMYDYLQIVKLSRIAINNAGLSTLFSKNYKNNRLLRRNSPKYYLNLGFVFPEMLLVYSKNDVFNFQSKRLKKDFKKYKRNLDVYFESDESCPHIFHHFNLNKDTSIKANEYIINFLMK